MGVGFSIDCEATIRGAREDIARIPEVILAADLEDDEFDECLMAVEEALQSQDNPITIVISGFVSSDDARGYSTAFLSELDKRIPELEIAVYEHYSDEYGAVMTRSYCSPKGESALDDEERTTEFSHDNDLGDPLPPYAEAEMTLAFLGDWTKDERAIVREALNNPELSAALFCEEWSVSDSENGAISVNMSGLMDFSEIARNLHAALADLLTPERREIYARLCEAMREKKLLIALTIHQSTGPACVDCYMPSWDYQCDEVWRFLVSSDGEQLISRYEDVEKQTKEIDGTMQLADMVYDFYMDMQRENTDNEELAEERAEEGYVSLPDKLNSLQRFFAHKAILTNSPELSEINIEPESLEFNAIYEVLHENFIYDCVTPELSQAVAEAIEAADAFAVTPAPPVVPASFDRRFAGKTFAVKGDDFGAYAPGEIERMITAFGGAVAEEIANGADFVVCGASMGKAFDDALQCGAALLSPEYFEDMTR